MAFDNAIFPYNISYSSKGGPSFMTNIIETDSGAEQRVSRWELPRHKYDISYAIKSQGDLMLVKRFFIARLGCAVGFRFRDPGDFSSAVNGIDAPSSTDEYMVAIDGSTTTFQLVKRYTSGSTTRNRTITKLDIGSDDGFGGVTGDVLVAVSGVDVTSGFSVNQDSGIVTFDSAPATLPTAGFYFHTPVRFDKQNDEWLQWSFDDFDNHSTEVLLIEVRDIGASVGSSEFDYGGADIYCLDADKSLTMSDARVQEVKPETSDNSITLPDISTVPAGGPIFYFINIDDTNSFDLFTFEDDSDAFVTLAAGKSICMLRGVDGSDNPIWIGTGA